MKRVLTILLVCFLSLSWFGLFSSSALAAEEPPAETTADENPYSFNFTKEEQAAYFDAVIVCDTPSLECLVHHVTRFSAMEWIYNILGPGHRASLGDPDEPKEPEETTYNPDADPREVMADSGIVGGLGYMMGSMYANPIASSGTYIADVLDSAHIATPAYAQGLGFASLDPILPLWKNFRNLAYLFFVVIFIVIGFMIMFRTKIGGQTAVTAQQAIPQVIISLLFVTFSYAIAGLLIDAMYIVMILILGIFGENFGTGNDNILSYNIINLFGMLWKAGPANVDTNIAITNQFLSGFSGSSNSVTTALGFLSGLMLTLLLAVAVLIGSVRLFFELLKSYASIILSVVTSPVTLMFGAIPGKNVFGPWVKDLIGNLLPFPTVLVVVVMFYQFTDLGRRTSGGFNPPFLLNSADAGTLSALMGLAIILALPDIVKKVKEPLTNKNGIGLWLADTAKKNAMESLPLGGRLSMGAGGGAAGAAVGGVVGGAKGFGRGVRTIARNPRLMLRAPQILLGQTAGGLASGAASGGAKGARMGVKGAADLSRSIGANQPDWLNPITRTIDKIDPELSKKEGERQADENRMDLLRRILQGGG